MGDSASKCSRWTNFHMEGFMREEDGAYKTWHDLLHADLSLANSGEKKGRSIYLGDVRRTVINYGGKFLTP